MMRNRPRHPLALAALVIVAISAQLVTSSTHRADQVSQRARHAH